MEPNQTPNQENTAVTPPVSNQEPKEGLAILSYIGILVFIPLLMNKGNKFVKFHAQQGLVLFFVLIIAKVLRMFPVFGWIASPALSLFCLILMVIGIVHVANKNMKELPVIGQFAKNFDF